MLGRLLLKCTTIFITILFSDLIFGQSSVNQRVLDTLGSYQSATCLIIYDGAYTCTGTLLNNTSEDGRLLILSAAHCIDAPSQIESVVIVLGRQRLVHSSNISGLEWRSSFGAELLSYSSELDFALLELKQDVPDELMLHFLGWDRSAQPVSTTSTIHHPNFDFKEMTHSRGGAEKKTFNGLENTLSHGHWEVPHWTFGETVIGSSGAALLDQQLKVIGGLSGSTKVGERVSDYFFRFDKAWNFSSPNNLKDHLDPAGKNVVLTLPVSFTELRNLDKISNYQFTDSLSDPTYLEGDMVVSQRISNIKEGNINGVYLPILQIGADLLNTITITLLSSGNIIHVEEVSLFKLDENEENYIPFLAEIPFEGDFSIEFRLNSNLEGEFVSLPKTSTGDILLSVLSRFSKMSINDQVFDNKLLLFPNPSNGLVILDEFILEVTIYDQGGSEVVIPFENNAFGQTIFDFRESPPATYYIRLITEDNESFVDKIIIR